MPDLAIHGGKPVRDKMLPYGRQWVDEDDIRAVVEVLRSDWLTTGPSVPMFEEAFAAQVGARYAVAVSSGTAALHAAAFAIGIGQEDRAIVPVMTFAASANCIRYQGGAVDFVDVRSDTLNLDVAKAAEAIMPGTRAIVTVDYAGQPSDLSEIRALADSHGLMVIEDACHALGAVYHGRPVGTLAHLTVFSLHPVKHITTGEGGVITTEEPELAARLRIFRNHGITSSSQQRKAAGSWFYEMVELGYNYRLTDLQCALGRSQLRKLLGWLSRRRAIAARYTKAFGGIAALEVPAVLEDRRPAWHLYVLRLYLDRLGRAGRAEIFRALHAENIGVNVHYIPVPWHPYYQKLGYTKGRWPVAEAAYERLVSLPIFPAMSDSDVEDVIEGVQKVVEYYAT